LLQVSSWGWSIYLSPAFVGTGILMGTRSALSFILGAFVSYAILGPLFVNFSLGECCSLFFSVIAAYLNSVNRAWGFQDMKNP